MYAAEGRPKPRVDLVECVRDSPLHHAALSQAEADVASLDARISGVVRTASAAVARGAAYSQASAAFVAALRDLSAHEAYAPVAPALSRFAAVLADLEQQRAVLLEQVSAAVVAPLTRFSAEDVPRTLDATRQAKHVCRVS
jgi:hypothetical protein